MSVQTRLLAAIVALGCGTAAVIVVAILAHTVLG